MDKIKKKNKKNYLNNEEFLRLLIEYKETKVITNELAGMFLLLCEKLLKSPNFINYSDDWKAEMKSDAAYNFCRYAKTFDITKKNPFAYFTSLVINSYRFRINAEKENTEQDMIVKNKLFDDFLISNNIVEEKNNGEYDINDGD